MVKDQILEVFVISADGRGETFGLTLTIGGILISGTLIGIDEYHKLLDLQLRGEGGQKDEQERPDARTAVESRLKLAGQLEDYHPEFLHMKDAHVFYAQELPSKDREGFLWRGKLDAVDGFSLGVLLVSPASSTPDPTPN